MREALAAFLWASHADRHAVGAPQGFRLSRTASQIQEFSYRPIVARYWLLLSVVLAFRVQFQLACDIDKTMSFSAADQLWVLVL